MPSCTTRWLCVVVLCSSLPVAFQQDAECPEPEINCAMMCEFGFRKDANGCDVCACAQRLCADMYCQRGRVCTVYQPPAQGKGQEQDGIASCVDPSVPEVCWGPVERGPCKARFTRWYYDHHQGECAQFVFGGCGGNSNNFETQEACMGTCNPGKAPSHGACPSCPLVCRNGYLQDDSDRCVCQCSHINDQYGDNNVDFQVDVGCDGAGETFCDLRCDSGYQMDSNGCTRCACMPPEGCPNTACEMYCPNGRSLDARGCEVCECRLDGECPAPRCLNMCPYGRATDENGCERCMCAQDPCQSVECPLRTECKVENTTRGFEAQCITSSSFNNPGCTETPCKMFCEYGFTTDRRGCERCECRDNSTCEEEMCAYCEFGNVYTEMGCRMCTCLVDPCMSKVCSKEEACVAVRYESCEECNPYPVCVASTTVHRVSVNMEYFFDSSDTTLLDFDTIKKELRKQMVEMMEISDDSVAFLEVERTEMEDHIRVNYHILKRDGSNLVHQYKTYREKLLRKQPSFHSFTVDGVEYTPRTESLMASYSENESLPNSAASSSGRSYTAIVIGCVIAVLLGVVLIAMLGYMVYARKNQKEEPRKNVIYKKSDTAQSFA